MILHTFTNILVKKFFGNNLVNRFSYVSLTISYFKFLREYTIIEGLNNNECESCEIQIHGSFYYIKFIGNL